LVVEEPETVEIPDFLVMLELAAPVATEERE